MFPVRLSFVTYNLWNTMRWLERGPALKQFVDVFRPDVLCVQELRAETRSFLDDAMPLHSRVQDDFPGWTCESNIYWNSHLLEEVEHGAEDIGIVEEYRRLFWVRLKLKGENRTVFVSTAHFTYQGNARERETGLSPRVEQSHWTVHALERLVRDNEPAFFMGDLNDSYHPIWILHEAGYSSCFADLSVPCPPTSPCYPTVNMPAGSPLLNRAIDWIVSNRHARTIAAQVPHFYYGDVGASDHWPVLAVYEI
jgi:endonuclease/exonuclease/phosphatase family metal-dependent hydrolase